MSPLSSTGVLPGVVSALAFDRDYLIAGLKPGSWRDGGLLAVFNAVDPQELTLVSLTELPFEVRDVAATADTAVVVGAGGQQFNSTGPAGRVALVDTSMRTKPVVGETVDLYAPVDAVAIDGDRVFVIEADVGTARIVVRRFAANPAGGLDLEATIELDGWPGARLAVAGSTVFVTGDSFGLHVLSSREGLTLLSTIRPAGCATDVDYRAGTLVVADACTPAVHMYDARVPSEPRLIGQTGSDTYRVALEDDVVLTATGASGSVALVRTDGGTPRVTGAYTGLGTADRSTRLGEWVVGVNDSAGAGFERWDLAGSGSASRRRELRNVTASGVRFYGADPEGRQVRIYSVAESGLVETGSIPIEGNPWRLEADAARLLVADAEELKVMRLDEPDAPRQVASVAASYVQRIVLHGRLAAVTGSDNVEIYDLADEASPRLTSSVRGPGLGGWEGSSLDGRRLAVSFYDIFDPLGWITVYDVGNPATPVREASFQGRQEVPASLALTGSTLLMGSGGEVVEVTLAGQPVHWLAVPGDVVSLEYDATTGRALAGAGAGGVLELRRGVPQPTATTAPEQPTRTPTAVPEVTRGTASAMLFLPAISVARAPLKPGRVLKPLFQYTSLPGDLATSAGRLIRAEGGHLVVYDVSGTEAITEVGRTTWTGYARAVALDGDLAVAAGESELRVYEIGENGTPRQVGSLALADAPAGLALHRDQQDRRTALVAAGDAGLLAVNVDAPERPAVVGRLAILGGAKGVSISGDLAFVWSESWAEPTWVVDISDRTRPQTLSRLVGGDLDGGGPAVADGNLAFSTTCGNCLEAFDISDPSHPRWIDNSWTESWSSLSVARDGWVYTDWPLKAVDYRSPGAPVVMGLPKSVSALALAESGGRLFAGTEAFPEPYVPESAGSARLPAGPGSGRAAKQADAEPLAEHLGSLIEFDVSDGLPRPVRAYDPPVPWSIVGWSQIATDGDDPRLLAMVRVPQTTPGRIPGEPEHGCTLALYPGQFLAAKTIDLSGAPSVVTSRWVPELCDAIDLDVDGDLIYATVALDTEGTREGVRVVRLPADGPASVLREVELPPDLIGGDHEGFRPFQFSAGVAYLWDNDYDEQGNAIGAAVIAVDVRSDAATVSDVRVNGAVASIDFGPDGLVYAAAVYPPRILTIDASDPAQLRVVGQVDLPDLDVPRPEYLGPLGVLSHGNAVYAGSLKGLYVFDASDPRNLRLAPVVPAVGAVMTAADRSLLVGAWGEAARDVLALDLSDPLAPRIAARAEPPGPDLYASFGAHVGRQLYAHWASYDYDAKTRALSGLYIYQAR